MSEKYFVDLNYTLSNEETRVEYKLLKDKANSVFSISGSGARCLPLLAKNPQKMTVIDLSSFQLMLCELRYQAVRALTHDEFLFFMGYRGALTEGLLTGDDRYELFKKINLSAKTHEYFLQNKTHWQTKGFIKLGKWESHFQKLSHLFRSYLQFDFTPIFEAQSLQEQIELYQRHWPHLRWKAFLKIAASEYVFNKYLYKGHFSGRSNQKTESRSPSTFIEEEFHRIFHTQLVRKNYFMQILFLGKIAYEEGLPFEATLEVFNQIKTSTTQIEFIQGNLLDVLKQEAFDFISLSDTISYLPDQSSKEILQGLHPNCPSGTRIVIRSFLKQPIELIDQGWKRLKDQEQWAHQIDGTAVYEFMIFEKN